MKRRLEINSPRLDFPKLIPLGSIIISFGIILVTSGGSWDISNHLLNKPETFFSPPHAVLYVGVGIAFFGFGLLYVSWKKTLKPRRFQKGIKIAGLGIALLLGAGPADFAWHSSFGLDGLLSPPHMVLILGMILSSIGALVNTINYLRESKKLVNLLIIIGLLPVWMSLTGVMHSLSLPFSETDHFNFNPHPIFAAIFAASSYPFLISAILVTASILSSHRFGIASIVGFLYLLIMTLTAIIPNESLVITIPFYWMNIIPIVMGDLLISKVQNKNSLYVSGAIFGSIFFFVYFPLITYTYNEIIFHKIIWPSLTTQIYFEMTPIIAPILICSGIVAGIFGSKFAQKLTNPIIH